MIIEPDFRKQVQSSFGLLNARRFVDAVPSPRTLSGRLESLAPKKQDLNRQRPVDPEIARLFAAGSVEMWMRAVHSFLISASLTNASPIWASTCGYYASHYSVRALAHLLGHFQLHHASAVVHIERHSGSYHCTFDRKGGGDREHKIYWRLVKQDPHFEADPYFTQNLTGPGQDDSDAGHRDHANYADFLFEFPIFRALDAPTTRARIEYLSGKNFDTPPIPRLSSFPDLDRVQVVAYYRIVKFRSFLNEVLDSKNHFWDHYKTPVWAQGLMDFQKTDSPIL